LKSNCLGFKENREMEFASFNPDLKLEMEIKIIKDAARA